MERTGRVNMLWTILCFSAMVLSSNAQSIDGSNRLSLDLKRNYNRRIRGVRDMRELTKLYFTFNLVRIAEYDEVNGKLSLVGYFTMFWHDFRMEWDPKNYNNTENIIFEEKDVWVPLLVLSSPQDEFQRVGDKDNFFIRYSHKGVAEWYPGDIWVTACTPDVYLYPYDTQNCEVTYVVWGYAITEVTAEALSDEIGLHVYSSHGMWDLINTMVKTDVDRDRGLTILKISLEMKRISTFHLINMILPIVFVGLLNILVFLLPAQSGERVGYSITVLLAIAVFQTIASDNLPAVSKPQVSLLCIKLLVDLVVSALVMTFTIVTLYFYHMPESRDVPSCVAAATRFLLCKNCCKNTKQRSNNLSKESRYKESVVTNKIGTTKFTTDNNNIQISVTWADVGKSSDIVFSILSMVMFFASNIVFILLVILKKD